MRLMYMAGNIRLRLIDFLGGTQIRKVYNDLNAQQYFPLEKLKEIQKNRFDEIFNIAKTSTRFYEYTKSYEKLEPLDKTMIREHFDSFVSKNYNHKLYKKSTGGSTGIPLVYYTTSFARSYLWAGILLSWNAAGYKLGDKVAFIAGSSIFKSNIKHKLFYWLFNIKTYSAFNLNDDSINEYIIRLNMSKVKYIYGYASAINFIAEYIHKNGIHYFPHLKGIISTAEVLTDKMRINISTAFKAEVFNQYGCNEAGISAFECEYHHLHLISTRSYYDVDADGNLISTDLSNKGFILLKYLTGDKIKFSEIDSCPCKRSFPIIDQIDGRTSDVITDKFNNSLHCIFFNILFREDPRIKQFQILYNNETINVFMKVDTAFLDVAYYDSYMQEIKKHLAFDTYNLILNPPFLKSENSKHRYIIKTD